MNDDRKTISIPDDVFKYHSDDPDFISASILEEPPLCMVLNNDINPIGFNKIVSQYYVYAVEYEGEQRYAVAGGFYKEKQAAFDKIDPKKTAGCNAAKKWVNGGGKDTPVLEERLDLPLSILISDELEAVRLEMLKGVWQTIQVEHKGNKRDAIACVYFDPDYDPGPGRVISQHMIMQPTEE